MIKFFCFFITSILFSNISYAEEVALSGEEPKEVIVRKIEKNIVELPSCSDEKLVAQTKEFIIEYYKNEQLSNIYDRRRKHFILSNIDKYSPENIENYKSEKTRPVSDVIIDTKINKGVLEENMRLCKNLSQNKEASNVYLLIFSDNKNIKVTIINLKKNHSIEDDTSFIYK